MKQTAIEWFANQLGITNGSMLEQAKEMEKQQIINSYTMGSYDMAEKEFRPEQYYNETYKQE